jgi:hypothetical protein
VIRGRNGVRSAAEYQGFIEPEGQGMLPIRRHGQSRMVGGGTGSRFQDRLEMIWTRCSDPGNGGEPPYPPWQTSLSGPSARERMVSSAALLHGVTRRPEPNPGRSIAVAMY